MAGGKGGGLGGRGNKPGSKRKGAQLGSGGNRRKSLEGKGPTPRAENRTGHPAARNAAASAKRAQTAQRGGRAPAKVPYKANRQISELIAGRNSVVEALRSGVPAVTLYVAQNIDFDDRVREAITLATQRGVPLLEVPRPEVDRLTDGAIHQGVALQIPPYQYAHSDDLLTKALDAAETPLIVALDGVTDPRNLGAVIRSAAAFGAHGVVVPERRSAGMTAGAWKTSAGAAARLPVAQVVNLTRVLESYKKQGLLVAGLSARGTIDLSELEAGADPLVLVVGSEGKGLSRLVEQTCDVTVRIPIAAATESLNAGVATSIALYEIAQRRLRSSRL
ncbi:MAG TPA: 23S rRNA (guanosine(2251)-2'-O)-methyltransferase RlmB [Actinocrinis sp.]|jgi:23S rRNA (guanosine2251-2'-O)-methyltransferase|uniref:23S rRNA (guanosine(2251)-2'-O)-methyltransferase RlmB n=1 Tax=Actinocrinis sp. TaxID=1920516 RepID=UPI002DDD8CEA|nr:23S rRNA (guanosine(2251)-2'-O)-methyltransferase RlmB [Actinocrinis sp.]HEV3173909.1 23S rRNA (guanosine(2251)-2'-O)-methyltransferase RlmB [Actinocrinis sp.]